MSKAKQDAYLPSKETHNSSDFDVEKQKLEHTYTSHHQRGKRYGYLFCAGARAPYLQRWIGVGKKVLDLGCRDGMLTQSYAQRNEVLGADIDRTALLLAQERIPHLQTAWLNLNQEWPFEPASQDVIVACEILEHIYDLPFVMGSIRKTLKPGGIFIGSVPNAFRIRNRWKFLWGKPFETDPTHVRSFSYDCLQKMLLTHFTQALIVPIQGKVLPFLPVGSSLPLRINRLFAKDLLWRAQ